VTASQHCRVPSALACLERRIRSLSLATVRDVGAGPALPRGAAPLRVDCTVCRWLAVGEVVLCQRTSQLVRLPRNHECSVSSGFSQNGVEKASRARRSSGQYCARRASGAGPHRSRQLSSVQRRSCCLQNALATMRWFSLRKYRPGGVYKASARLPGMPPHGSQQSLSLEICANGTSRIHAAVKFMSGVAANHRWRLQGYVPASMRSNGCRSPP